jgi:twitching motility protein PilT
MNIDALLNKAIEQKASDLHLSAGLAPMLRIDGDLQAIDDTILSGDGLKKALLSIMTPEEQEHYNDDLEYDFSYQIDGLARFRVNAFHQLRGPGAVFRVIPDEAVTLEAIEAPEIFKTICDKPHGLVLITGPTGSGKSTTMSAMIDYINAKEAKHVITIENPIEFVHKSKKCLINQREVGQNTKSFSMALRCQSKVETSGF